MTESPRLVSDGGQELEEDQQGIADRDAVDDDPFLWSPAVEATEESADPARNGTASADDAGSRGVEQLPAPPGVDGSADVRTRIRTMEQRLNRLSDIASDVSLAALNGDLKLGRSERGELETIHERIQMHAEHVEREVDRLTDNLEALEEAFTAQATSALREPAQSGSRTDGPGGRGLPALDGSVVPVQSAGSDRTTPAGVEGPPEADAETATDIVEPRPDREDTTTVEPAIDQLIPGTELRDMWRISRRTARNGDGGLTKRSHERWIIETRPTAPASDDDEAPEFPPEVTEFTLDDDEIPFEVLLELVSNDESS